MSLTSKISDIASLACSSPGTAMHQIARAYYLSRYGRNDAAKSALLEVKKRLDAHRLEKESIVSIFAEGVIEFQAGNLIVAVDRLRRATALSSEIRGCSLIEASARTWLSHLYFNLSKYDLMKEELRKLAVSNEMLGSEFAGRVLLTLGDALTTALEIQRSRDYYEGARCHAMTMGDTLGVARIAYNRAALTMARLRFSIYVENELHENQKTQLMELDSAVSLSNAFGVTEFIYPLVVWQARSEMIKEDYRRAEAMLTGFFAQHPESATMKLSPAFRVDLAFCHYRCGDLEAALSLADQLDARELSAIDADDGAVAAAQLSIIYAEAGNLAQSALYATLRDQFANGYRRDVSRLLAWIPEVSTQIRSSNLTKYPDPLWKF